MEIEWKPNWYITRLHAFRPEGRKGLCGAHAATHTRGEWQQRRLKSGVPKCKHCLKKVGNGEA